LLIRKLLYGNNILFHTEVIGLQQELT